MTPLKAIRAYCPACSNGQPSEVRLCPMTGCELYGYRTGHGRGRELTEDQREARADRMRLLRKSAGNSSGKTEEHGSGDGLAIIGAATEKTADYTAENKEAYYE